MTDDAELLNRYAAERSELAFAEFVQRHLGLAVHATTVAIAGGGSAAGLGVGFASGASGVLGVTSTTKILGLAAAVVAIVATLGMATHYARSAEAMETALGESEKARS